MAVEDLGVAYNIRQFTKNLERVEHGLSFIDKNLIVYTHLQQLKQQLDLLKNKEQAIFQKFEGVKNIDDLNMRLREYKNYTLKLSGPELYRTFIYQLEENNRVNIDILNNAAREAVQAILLEPNNQMQLEISKGVGKGIASLMTQVLNDFNKEQNSRGRYRSERGWSNITDVKKIQEQFDALLITKTQREAIIAYMKKKLSHLPAVQKYIEEEQAIKQKTNSITFNWYDAISIDDSGPLTQKKYEELKAQIDADSSRRAQIQTTLMNKIVEQTDDQYKPIMQDVIKHILTIEPNFFFTGKSVNDITGNLGEIQALFYLCLLTGKSAPDASLYWKGGKIINGAKPHQDIVLDKMGIQVKNTTTDILKNRVLQVGFWDKRMDTFLADLQLSPEVQSVFKQYYTLYVFNTRYVDTAKDNLNIKQNGKSIENNSDRYIRAESSRSETFEDARARLESLQPQIDALMSLFAVSIMYMDISDNINPADANSLYILGGVAAVTASSIIEKILDEFGFLKENQEIQPLSSFTDKNIQLNTQVYFKDGNRKDIVYALNNKQRGKDFTQEVLESVFLRSSYMFSIPQQI